jgi:GNAT superfamily N-acetyltransferase
VPSQTRTGLLGTADATDRLFRLGVCATLYAKVMNGLKRIFGLHLFSVYTGHHEIGGEVGTLPEGLEMHILTPTEVRRHVDEPRLDFRDASVTQALARGDVCIGAFEGDQLVAFTWRALKGPVPHTPLWDVVWNPGLVYRYKAYTLPEYRGLHIHEVLSKEIDRYLGEQGHTVGLSFIETHNFSSIRTLARKVRRRIGYAGYIQKSRLCFSFRTAGCRRLGFAFRRVGRL